MAAVLEELFSLSLLIIINFKNHIKNRPMQHELLHPNRDIKTV